MLKKFNDKTPKQWRMWQLQLGEKIKLLRHRHHLTQTTLSQQIGVCRMTVSHIENSRVIPDAITLWKIAQFFNCQLDDFFLDDEPN